MCVENETKVKTDLGSAKRKVLSSAYWINGEFSIGWTHFGDVRKSKLNAFFFSLSPLFVPSFCGNGEGREEEQEGEGGGGGDWGGGEGEEEKLQNDKIKHSVFRFPVSYKTALKFHSPSFIPSFPLSVPVSLPARPSSSSSSSSSPFFNPENTIITQLPKQFE